MIDITTYQLVISWQAMYIYNQSETKVEALTRAPIQNGLFSKDSGSNTKILVVSTLSKQHLKYLDSENEQRITSYVRGWNSWKPCMVIIFIQYPH